MAGLTITATKLYLFLAICRVTLTESSTAKYSKQRLVLISFDGFRHDYIDRENLQNFKRFAREGVKAKSLQPSFVTKTFPNHFTMVTGLYEESHGIISNHMYDPVYKESFSPKNSSHDPKWWNAATPLWIQNEEQTIEGTHETGKSATIFWPGSETTYNNKSASFYFHDYNSNYTTKERLKKIVHLLLNGTDLNFVACYIEQPDRASHRYGPDSKQTSEKLKELDQLFGYFLEMIAHAGLDDKVNIMVVSDHGFTSVKDYISLDEYLKDPSDYFVDSYGAFLLLRPAKNNSGEIYNALKSIPHASVYYKHELPDRWHYKHNRRIPEIVVVAEEGYYIAPKSKIEEYRPRGDHGYDNKLESMHGIFLARGPAFKKNLKVQTISNVDLCPLMCHILGLKPHPHNGSLERVKNIISEKTIFTVIMKKPALMIALLSVCGVLVAAVVLGCTVSCFRNFVESSKYRRVHEDMMPLADWHEDDDEVTEYQFGSR